MLANRENQLSLLPIVILNVFRRCFQLSEYCAKAMANGHSHPLHFELSFIFMFLHCHILAFYIGDIQCINVANFLFVFWQFGHKLAYTLRAWIPFFL